MSVILDALAKARGDKRNQQGEPQPNSVARVLDTRDVPRDFVPGTVAPRRRNWLAGVAIVFGLVCLLALIGGGFLLLYDQVRRVEARSVMHETVTVESPGQTRALLDTTPLDVTPPSALPPPIPESELPVQVPATAGSAPQTAPPIVPSSDSAISASAPVDLPVASADVANPGAVAQAGFTAKAAEPARPEFRLGSIVCEGGLCIASLNGRSVRVGDEIRGYKVRQITETGITLQAINGTDTMTMSLFD